ncbi:MAG TPA: serpin family protein, partial [Verrucomicrobiae bacterium]|nr:serpin family protein [Verrucomicrobiae bacterium]
MSPPGVAFALSVVANGAKGETLTQMVAALKVKDISMADLNTANKALLDLLTSQNSKLKLEIANGLWTDKNAVIEPEFAAVAKSSYKAGVFNADFKDPSFVKTINDWVSAQTDGKIPQIVQAPLDPLLRVIVLDAIYFKGVWVRPSNASVTADFGLRSGGIKQQPVGVALFVLGQRIKGALENAEGVAGSFREREQDAHQDFAGQSALLGLRTKA